MGFGFMFYNFYYYISLLIFDKCLKGILEIIVFVMSFRFIINRGRYCLYKCFGVFFSKYYGIG